MRIGEPGIEPDGLVEMDVGSVQLTAPHEQIADVVVSTRMPGIGANRRLILGQRVIDATQAAQDVSEIAVRRRVVGLQAKRLG